MEQLFIKLRGTIFAESGYCFDAPKLHKDVQSYFLTLDADGKPRTIDEVPGCSGDCKSVVNVTLKPYPNPEQAVLAVQLMCRLLGDAVKGDTKAREMFAGAWRLMISQGMALQSQDEKTFLALGKNFFGEGRMIDALNRNDPAVFTATPDAMLVREALGAAA